MGEATARRYFNREQGPDQDTKILSAHERAGSEVLTRNGLLCHGSANSTPSLLIGSSMSGAEEVQKLFDPTLEKTRMSEPKLNPTRDWY